MSETDESDGAIGAKMDRIREIVARLEDGEVSVERAKELRDEGKDLLHEVEERLDLDESSVEVRGGNGD